MVPLLADYVLFHYGWRYVCGLFSFFCFLSSLFGFFLEPPKCLGRFFEMSIECKEGEYTMNSEKYDEIKSMDEEGLDNHTDDILSKDAQTPILLMQEKKLEKLEEHRKNSIIAFTNKNSHLKKNKSESCLYAFDHCVTPYKRLRKIVEHDVEASKKGKIEYYNYSVVSCIDMLLNLEHKERFLKDGIVSAEKSCFSLQSQLVEASNKHNVDNSKNCDETKIKCISKNEDGIIEKEEFLVNNEIRNGCVPSLDVHNYSTYKNTMMDRLALFRDLNFLLFCVSNVMLFMALNIPFAYGPDMMVKRNIVSQDNGSNFNMAIGFTCLISMPLVGILVDHGPKLNPFVVTFLSLVSAGISMFIFPMTWSLDEAIVVAIWFGISFSAFLSLPPVILENILGKENVSSAYGLLVFIRGISISVGPPLAGLIYDITNTYNGSFFFAGILFSISGLPILFVYIFHKRRSNE